MPEHITRLNGPDQFPGEDPLLHSAVYSIEKSQFGQRLEGLASPNRMEAFRDREPTHPIQKLTPQVLSKHDSERLTPTSTTPGNTSTSEMTVWSPAPPPHKAFDGRVRRLGESVDTAEAGEKNVRPEDLARRSLLRVFTQLRPRRNSPVHTKPAGHAASAPPNRSAGRHAKARVKTSAGLHRG